MPITVEVNFAPIDNLDKKIPQAIADGLKEIGDSIVEGAKAIVPVRTGRLRDSISIQELGPQHVTVGAATEYADAVEYGTYRMAARPYIGPQLDRMQSEAPRIIQDKINRVL
jgi:HK97 gp10 family phage protein